MTTLKKKFLPISLFFGALFYLQSVNGQSFCNECGIPYRGEKVYTSFDNENPAIVTTIAVRDTKLVKQAIINIEQYKNLRVLDLSIRYMDRPDSFLIRLSKLEKLEQLTIDNLLIDTLRFANEGYNSLHYLSAKNCGIDVVDSSIGQLGKLRYLNLGLLTGHRQMSNQISSLPNSIVKLKNLQCLIIASNRLEVIPSCIYMLNKLECLMLGSNKISRVSDSIALLGNLKRLDLGSNQLDIFPIAITKLNKLRTLWIDNNIFTSLSPNICEMAAMEELDLGNNPLTHLPSLGCLNKLKLLSIKNTKLSSFPRNKIPKSITDLRIENIPIKSLSPLDFPNLSRISINKGVLSNKNKRLLLMKGISVLE
jgi:Leucine-rich repeat (LRR) protein